MSKKNSKKKKKSVFKKIIISILWLILTSIILVLCASIHFYILNKTKISDCISDGYEKINSINENTFHNRYSTKFYDKDNNLLKEFKNTNYVYKSYNEINPLVFDATVSIEDERFYEHKGIDYKGILRAGVKYLTSKGQEIQGGSTITQQLCKYTFLTLDRNMWRKLEEMVIAQELEKKYSKNEILEFYVNNNYFGYGCYGIESASEYFFQKSTNDLTLSEIALLVGIPNNPTIFDPIKNLDKALNRKNIILNKMFELGYINEADFNKAKSEEINLNVKDISIDNTVTDYDLDFAINESTKVFMKIKGFQFKYKFNNNEERTEYFNQYNSLYNECREELLTGGYDINTCINRTIQNQLQWYIDNELQGETEVDEETGIYKRQAAATVIDNSNGTVVAIVGGRTQEGNTYNRALLSARQPGSAIKPLIAYTPAFENGHYPDELYEDKAIDNGPKNWFNGYYGSVSLRYALETSVNTIPYRLMNNLGVDKCINYLTNMHFKYITPNDNSPILAVGGWTKGATSIEMAGGFATLAHNGKFIEPTNVLKITKVGLNKVIYENTFPESKVYDAGASFLTTDCLKGVLTQNYATAYGYAIDNFTNQAGKTGSTDDYKDLWMAGYTPYYTTVVWNGEDNPTPLYSNMSASKNIWKNIMTYLHQGLQDKPFERPDSIYEEDGHLKNKIVIVENKLLKSRKENEEKRKSSEINEQMVRLKENSYRIEFGLSDKEEENREKKAEFALSEVSKYELTSLNQESEIKHLLNNCYTLIEDVKRESLHDKYLDEYKTQAYNFNSKLYELKSIEEEKQMAEKRKQEELEQKRREEELKKQQELEKENNSTNNIEDINDNTNNSNDNINNSENNGNNNIEGNNDNTGNNTSDN